MDNLPHDAIEVRRELETALAFHQENLTMEKKTLLSVREKVAALRRAILEQRTSTERSVADVQVEKARQKEADKALTRQRARYAGSLASQAFKTVSELKAERSAGRATVFDLMMQLKRLQLVVGPLGQQSRVLKEAMERLNGDMQLLADQHRLLEALSVSEQQKADEALQAPVDQPTNTRSEVLKARWVHQAVLLDELKDSELGITAVNKAPETNQCSDLLKDLDDRLAHQQRRNALLNAILKDTI